MDIPLLAVELHQLLDIVRPASIGGGCSLVLARRQVVVLRDCFAVGASGGEVVVIGVAYGVASGHPLGEGCQLRPLVPELLLAQDGKLLGVDGRVARVGTTHVVGANCHFGEAFSFVFGVHARHHGIHSSRHHGIYGTGEDLGGREPAHVVGGGRDATDGLRRDGSAHILILMRLRLLLWAVLSVLIAWDILVALGLISI